MWTASSFFCDLFYLNVCVFAYMHNLAEASRRHEMSWSSGFKVVSCLMPVLDQNPGSVQEQQAAVSQPLRLLLPSFNSFYNSSFRYDSKSLIVSVDCNSSLFEILFPPHTVPILQFTNWPRGGTKFYLFVFPLNFGRSCKVNI